MSNSSIVYVISESDRQNLITWLTNLSSATLNPTAPSETPVEETAKEAAAEEQAPIETVAQDAAEVTVESQT